MPGKGALLWVVGGVHTSREGGKEKSLDVAVQVCGRDALPSASIF